MRRVVEAGCCDEATFISVAREICRRAVKRQYWLVVGGFGDVLITNCYGLVERVVGSGLVGYIASDIECTA